MQQVSFEFKFELMVYPGELTIWEPFRDFLKFLPVSQQTKVELSVNPENIGLWLTCFHRVLLKLRAKNPLPAREKKKQNPPSESKIKETVLLIFSLIRTQPALKAVFRLPSIMKYLENIEGQVQTLSKLSCFFFSTRQTLNHLPNAQRKARTRPLQAPMGTEDCTKFSLLKRRDRMNCRK